MAMRKRIAGRARRITREELDKMIRQNNLQQELTDEEIEQLLKEGKYGPNCTEETNDNGSFGVCITEKS